MDPTFETEEMKQDNLSILAELEQGYTPNEAVRFEQSSKTFTGLIAPFGSGKTVIGDAVIRLEPRIQLINTSTSRHRKPEDQPNFKTADEGITTGWFVDKAQEGALTNFSVIPNTDVYGTLPEDFTGQYNIGPFLPAGLEHIRKSGLNNFHAVYIVTPGELWRTFVNTSRRDLPEATFSHRVLESLNSINYALNHLNDFIFVKNDVEGQEGIENVARTISEVTLHNTSEDLLPTEEAVAYLENMKAVAEDLVSY